MKAVVAAFNQEKALVGAFSVITNLRMDLFEALVSSEQKQGAGLMFTIGQQTSVRLCPARRGGGASAAARSECGVWSVSGAETAGLATCTVDRVAAAAVDSDTHRKYFLRSA